MIIPCIQQRFNIHGSKVYLYPYPKHGNTVYKVYHIIYNPNEIILNESYQMSTQTKIIRGGFKATLALLISIISLILAIIAFNRTCGMSDLNAQLKELQVITEKMKKETSEKMVQIRQETSKALENLSAKIKKKESEP